ncbi:MAG: hypothetical protein PHC28_14985 [Flavobacterium sp.]|uniref:hypothetical protein n=1 Tax=Flavobacterium sp. TaxID=239 RepID=UPI0026214EEE|nr:hypothetical protein [Flavobacterium sp.]MDD5151758.1 hypothetical protein [Flavobacterium sp.]
MQLFRITWWATNLSLKEARKQYPERNFTQYDQVKYLGDRYEYIGDLKSTWKLWYELTVNCEYRFVEVFTLEGIKCDPEKGINYMSSISDTFGYRNSK